jgi:hypothetical protein
LRTRLGLLLAFALGLSLLAAGPGAARDDGVHKAHKTHKKHKKHKKKKHKKHKGHGGQGSRGQEGQHGVARDTTDTFTGSCSFHGTLYFSPPMTGTPQPLRMSAAATGTCTGTLTADGRTRQLQDEAATADSTSLGTTSCEASYQQGSGQVKLAGSRIDFDFLEPRGPLGTATWTGKKGGSAGVLARFSQDEDLPALFAKCSGPGVDSLRFDADIQTTPSISG